MMNLSRFNSMLTSTNEAYELQNEADVELIIESEDGKKFSYQFSKQNRNYSLSVGHFPPGEYRWHAQAQWGSKIIKNRVILL